MIYRYERVQKTMTFSTAFFPFVYIHLAPVPCKTTSVGIALSQKSYLANVAFPVFILSYPFSGLALHVVMASFDSFKNKTHLLVPGLGGGRWPHTSRVCDP